MDGHEHKIMIRRNPALPDHFLALERKETFGDYARAYGDAIAAHYENRGVVVVPHMPIDFDLAFFQSIAFPPQWKKIGTANGIEQSLYVRDGTTLTDRTDHPFRALGMGAEWATYLQSQVASFDWQLRRGLQVLFPMYRSLQDANITWRLTETVEEGMHLDFFRNGAPMQAGEKRAHRIKIFVNIDTEPRRWRTSLDLPGILEACRDRLPDALPEDVNVVNAVIDKEGVLSSLPFHEIEYPALSAVLCNGEAMAHEVTYGRRVVAGEFMCLEDDMLDPARHTHRCVGDWIRAAGIDVAPDAAAVADRYADRKGSYALIQEERAKRAS